ncbi:MAG TPA: AcvB/VirJ family lysyl-phosphatidylglycerol hydrolase [Thermoanaerobaculia bacterium]
MRRTLAALALLFAACATSPPPPGVIPLVEYGPKGTEQSPYFAVFVTGDGGWRKIDVKVSDVLRDAGMPVVGILANSYFARERTPEETGRDLDRVIRDYQAKWQRKRVIVIGYSRGAEAVPFMINNLPPDTRANVALAVLLGPSTTTSFRIHKPDRYPVLPAVRQLTGVPIVCVVGTLEKHSVCRDLPPPPATVVTIDGGHHFGGDYRQIGHAILDAVKRGE